LLPPEGIGSNFRETSVLRTIKKVKGGPGNKKTDTNCVSTISKYVHLRSLLFRNLNMKILIENLQRQKIAEVLDSNVFEIYYIQKM